MRALVDASALNDGRRGAGDILDGRYARGEIERDEYLQRKNDLEK
ncbi:MAG: SHOCT domain-containing protein [Acidimicrobiia bacterium]|jgi:uncharacterized membrane protein